MGCERKKRVKNDQVLLSQTDIRMVFPYSEILEKLGGDRFVFALWMGGNLEFSFVHVDLKCLLDNK